MGVPVEFGERLVSEGSGSLLDGQSVRSFVERHGCCG